MNVKYLSYIPSHAVFQCRMEENSNIWIIFDGSGEIIGQTGSRSGTLPVAISQFLNNRNNCWIARLYNGQFVEAKENFARFPFLPVE